MHGWPCSMQTAMQFSTWDGHSLLTEHVFQVQVSYGTYKALATTIVRYCQYRKAWSVSKTHNIWIQNVTANKRDELKTVDVTDLLEDLVDVDLVGFHGLALLLAGSSGLLHHLLGSGCLLCWGLDSLLTNLGSHCFRFRVSECLCGTRMLQVITALNICEHSNFVRWHVWKP